MRKFTFILLTAIAGTGIAASLLIQRHAEVGLRLNDAALRRQQDQIAALSAESRRSSDPAVQPDERGVSNGRIATVSPELAELRARAAVLQSQADQLSNQLWQSRVAAGTRLLSSLDSNVLDHNQETKGFLADGSLPRVKLNDARAYIAALRRYADEHQGVFPPALEQVAPYLPKPSATNLPPWAIAPVSGTNSFEIVFHGTTNDLANIPLGHVALIRETQPWPAPDGKRARVYGYADGNVSTVVSDDNFHSWDAEHIVPRSSAQ